MKDKESRYDGATEDWLERSTLENQDYRTNRK
jgi:hypothetical protein